ncbi:MAG: 1-acyl-sn-glycerol-3-phosphate acyltransferase [Oscillospiraceae bacterium]|nr:1-acyl-sn-glycerol-3-phosphate acyltransferase [Oscillospiraceae bacterium]
MLLGGIVLLSVLFAALMGFGAQGLHWLWVVPVSFASAFLVLVALAFGFLWLMCQLVDQNKEQQHDSKFYRTMMKLYISAVKTAVRLRIHTTGLEKLPREGRFLLVCNHTSLADPVILLHSFADSQLAFISKRENATMFLVGKAMHKIMCQTINRENDREALKTILKCIQLIKDDEVSIAVFPEGYIHKDKKLHRFRSGVFKIAQKTQVPIVVCTLKNSLQVIPNIPKLKATDVELHLLDVIWPEQYAGMTTVALGNRVYEMMAEDLGPDLVAREEENENDT